MNHMKHLLTPIWAILLPLLAIIPSQPLLAQEHGKADDYEKNIFTTTSGDTLNYLLLRPEAMKPGEEYPLIIFLHGAGQRGNDNQKQLEHGGPMWLNPVLRERYPAFVILPQCPATGYWAYQKRPDSFTPHLMPAQPELTDEMVAVKGLIETYASRKDVDEKRIYVMGLSMGGMATYDLAIRYPHLIAAAVPICGTVNPSRLKAAKDVKFRIYHGDCDNIVPVAGSRQAYKALKAAGADVTYTEFPGIQHESWYLAFADPGLFEWMFRQKSSFRAAQ